MREKCHRPCWPPPSRYPGPSLRPVHGGSETPDRHLVAEAIMSRDLFSISSGCLADPRRSMTRNGLSGRPDRLVGEAIGLMLDNQISGLPVMDEARRVVGGRGMFPEILSLIPRLPAPAAPA